MENPCTDPDQDNRINPRCDGRTDPVDLDPIPKGRGMCFRGSCYDKDDSGGLYTWLKLGKKTCPHSGVRCTFEEFQAARARKPNILSWTTFMGAPVKFFSTRVDLFQENKSAGSAEVVLQRGATVKEAVQDMAAQGAFGDASYVTLFLGSDGGKFKPKAGVPRLSFYVTKYRGVRLDDTPGARAVGRVPFDILRKSTNLRAIRSDRIGLHTWLSGAYK